MFVTAKSLQVGDLIITRPVEHSSTVPTEFWEEIISVGINMSYRTVDIRTDLAGQVRAAMGIAMDMELEIMREPS